MLDNNNLQEQSSNNSGKVFNDNSSFNENFNSEQDDSNEYYADELGANEPELSPFDRFAKVLTAPQEAFSGLLNSSKKGSIIIWGLVFTIIAYTFATIVVTSSDGMKQTIKEKQNAQFEKMKEEGKMTDEDIEKAQSMMSSDGMMIMFSIIGIAIGSPILWALFSLVYYLIARSLEKERHEGLVYSTAFAAMMITSVISMIQSVVQAIGALVINNEFSFGLDQIIPTENNILKFLLGTVNPFTIWWIVVAAIGISVLSRVERKKAIIVCFAVYLITGLGLSAISQVVKGFFSGFGA